MKIDYSALATRSASVIERFGGTVTLQRRSGGTFDAVTGTTSGEAVSNLETTGVILQFHDDLVDGTRIQRGDKRVVIDAKIEPLMSDTVLIGTQSWSIVDIKTVRPTDAAVIYEVHIRK